MPDPGLGETNYLVFLSNPNLNSVPALVSYLEGYPEAVEYAESYAGVIMDEPFSSAESRPIAKNSPKSGDMIPRAGEEDPLLAESPYFNTHNIPEVWKMSTGEGVVVAVVDSGFDMDHKDLVDNIWINEDEIPENGKDDDGNGYVDDRWGWDFGSLRKSKWNRFPEYSRQVSSAGQNHGTMMAGVIAATRNEHMVRGIAYDSKAMTIKAGGDFFGYSVHFSKGIALSIRYAVDNDADIINIALGNRRSRALRKAVEHAQKKGVLIVVGAGNSGKKISPGVLSLRYPGLYSEDYDNILTVGVVNNDGKRVELSDFSKTHVNMGVFDWQGYKILVENSTVLVGADIGGGTSTAAAVTSSVAALVKSLQPSWNGQKIRKHLEEHAIVYPGLANTFKTSGVLDIFGAVEAAHPGHLHFVEPEFQQFNEDDNSGVIPQVVYVFERQGGTKSAVSMSPKIYHIDTSAKDFLNNQLPTLTWLDGESGKKSVILKIADDSDLGDMIISELKWDGGQRGMRSIPIPIKDDMKMEKTEAIRIILNQDFPKKPTSLIDPQRREFILIIKDNDEGNFKIAD